MLLRAFPLSKALPGMSQDPLGRANEIWTTYLLSSESHDDGRSAG